MFFPSVDLTGKIHTKEDEFASLCSELQVIKYTTLGEYKRILLPINLNPSDTLFYCTTLLPTYGNLTHIT